jgi:hypothetical protein
MFFSYSTGNLFFNLPYQRLGYYYLCSSKEDFVYIKSGNILFYFEKSNYTPMILVYKVINNNEEKSYRQLGIIAPFYIMQKYHLI